VTAGGRPRAQPDQRGLVVDYGGVLTTSVAASFRDFERAEGLPKGTVFEIITEAYREAQATNPIARFETGASTPEEFAAAMVEHLRARGHEVDPAGLSDRIFAGTNRAPAMWAVVRRVKDAGVRTALLSNSWGTDAYPLEELRGLFDALVISGEVGLRKPDPEIYRLAAGRLGLEPDACVFVDDLERNVQAAREVGMHAVVHRDATTTAAELESFLGVPLAA
jgi:putative hydrolase of the HAD superfamily